MCVFVTLHESVCWCAPGSALWGGGFGVASDSITSRVVRSCADQLCGVMEHIFELSLRLGRVQQLWKNLLCCTSAKDSTSQELQRLQASSSDILPDEDPGSVGPGSASAPGELITEPTSVCLPTWHWSG